MRLGPEGGDIDASSENGDAVSNSSGVVAVEDAKGDEDTGFEVFGFVVVLLLLLLPPRVSRVGFP